MIIILLGVLLLINTALFSLPGFPGSLSKIIELAPGQKPPDVRLFYSPNEFYEFLTEIGPKGRYAFQIMHLTADLSFPLLYGMFFFLLIRFFALEQFRFLSWLGVITSIIDLAENITHLYITNIFPTQKQYLVRIAQIFTISKFAMIVICLFVLGYLITSRNIIRLKHKQA